MKNPLQDPEKLKRKHRQTFTLNELELDALNSYCEKYKIKNRAKFMRETIITAILTRFDEDYPRLFSESEMRGNGLSRTSANELNNEK